MTTYLLTAAHELSSAFVTDKRDDGTTFVKTIDGAADWIGDAVQAAHGGMMPDDYRYGMIRDIADAIREALDYDADADLDDERGEIVDAIPSVYHGARFAWLASNNSRADYCDAAREDGLVSNDASMSDLIAAGWYAEADEIFGALRSALNDRAEEIEASEPDTEESDVDA